ncbi:hypothetical protein PsYK624_172290 [Phanerochaete sordida]|uniref:Uncharacterized protein n=1 Tax=Phanerochaete sordida TaxID=48140 RepID=A0A9P3GZ13_9APHY|nr:hypothetical protein PsYK624_172290 [Phanerochaete sordida]
MFYLCTLWFQDLNKRQTSWSKFNDARHLLIQGHVLELDKDVRHDTACLLISDECDENIRKRTIQLHENWFRETDPTADGIKEVIDTGSSWGSAIWGGTDKAMARIESWRWFSRI